MINESVKKDRLKLNVCERAAARAAYSWIDHDAVVQWARANYFIRIVPQAEDTGQLRITISVK